MMLHLLAAVLLAAVESNTAEKHSNTKCRDSLLRCMQPVTDAYDNIPPDRIIGLIQSTSVSKFCGDLETAAQCFRREMATPDCAHFQPRELTDIYLPAISYMCDPQGRQMLQQIQRSTCLRDFDALVALERSIIKCWGAARRLLRPHLRAENANIAPLDPDVVCLILQQLFDCATTKAEAICGQVFEQFVSGFFDTVFVQVMIDRPKSFCDAHLHLTRSVSKRGLNWLDGIWTREPDGH